ncbi:unknown [Mycoplasma sp. CAG:877]|nr:unknown [Mycoplasma sp. CAG:877]
MIDSRKLDILYKNRSVYIDDKKYKFSISDITKDVLTNKKTKYSLVLIEVKYEGYDNDYLRLVFNDKKISLSEIFKIIWEGD